MGYQRWHRRYWGPRWDTQVRHRRSRPPLGAHADLAAAFDRIGHSLLLSHLGTFPARDQVEQWFGILQRKRLAIADFADKSALAERLHAFVKEWNEHAHPFKWTTKSVAKIMAKCEIPMAKVA